MTRLTALPSILALFVVAGDADVTFAQVGDLAQSNRISALEQRVRVLEGELSSYNPASPGRLSARVNDLEIAVFHAGYNPAVVVPRATATTVTAPGVVVRQAPFTSGPALYPTPATVVRPAVVVSSSSQVVGDVITLTPVRTAVRYGITSGGCANGRCPLR